MYLRRIGLVAAMLAAFGMVAVAQTPETKQQRDERMAWWRAAKFGLFIHWGVYSVPAGTYDGKQIQGIGEWIMNRGKIPVDVYAGYAKEFNPVKFNAEQWVLMAKNAGQKYIVITSKHHDGFAMFHSAVTPYNIFDATPFKRDVIEELAAACKKHDMKFGLYYSQAQDWHHAGGSASGGHWDPKQDGDMDKYIDEIAVPQVKEILTKYGKIAVLWWDTPIGMNKERAAKLNDVLKLQPGIIQNNRLGGGFEGDNSTPEQYIPATGIPGKDWEVCMTMNDTWGFKSYDHNWKSVEDLIHKLSDISSKGGNFLLNVGPTREGLIPQESVDRLAAVGKWMKTNGEAIYGTTNGPFPYLKWGRATRKGDVVYLHVWNWPADGNLRVPLSNKVKKAWLLADKSRKVTAKLDGEWLDVKLPGAAPDPIASVVALQVEGEPHGIQPPSAGKAGIASSSAAGFPASNAFDNNVDTRWKAATGMKTGWLQVVFDKPVRIGHVAIAENAARNGGIQKFQIECKDGDTWKTIVEGTKIGRSYSKDFAPVTTPAVRLTILESTAEPAIDEMQFHIE